MQRHPRHVWPARRDLDAVVTLADALRGAGDVGTAAPTRRCEHVARRGGVGMKRPMRAGMRIGLRLCGGWTGRLLPLRGRRARSVGRLRRKPQRRLKLGDPSIRAINAEIKASLSGGSDGSVTHRLTHILARRATQKSTRARARYRRLATT